MQNVTLLTHLFLMISLLLNHNILKKRFISLIQQVELSHYSTTEMNS